jgi:dihydroorotate dehydrogenase electron transfer subunit
MAEGTGRLLEVRLTADGLAGRLRLPANIRLAPGQYLLAAAPGQLQTIPVALFPAFLDGDEIELCPGLPVSWHAGMELRLRAPLGKGFQLPPAARRVALVSAGGQPSRLRVLFQTVLKQGAAVSLYTDRTLTGVPSAVEILPLEELAEAPRWADYLAVEIESARLTELPKLLGLSPFKPVGCAVEVLVNTPLICAGDGLCGVCAIQTRRGWKLACKDGPVFSLDELEAG